MAEEQVFLGQQELSGTPWQDFVETCKHCQACELCQGRHNVVVWRGAVRADFMIIGEGPGEAEDESGFPFVGASGQLLNTALDALDISAEYYHIANIVKCRPPHNRQPSLSEAKACRPLLNEQFKFVRPKVILLLGKSAYQYFTGDLDKGISKVRGTWIHKGIYWIMPTFHPSYVLREPAAKTEFWQDIKACRDKLHEMGLLPGIQT